MRKTRTAGYAIHGHIFHSIRQEGGNVLKQPTKYGIIGFIAGILNGIFGAGGGLLVVPMLESQKLPAKKAHATSIAIILPLSLISAAMYLLSGTGLDWSQLGAVLPVGAVGATAGAFLLMRLNNRFLKKLFAVVMIVSAVRLLLR